jgi:hypothetical protein
MPTRWGLDDLLQAFIPTASDVFDRVIPDCNVCGDKALPIKCKVCGEYACPKCAYLNAVGRSLVCGACIKELIDSDEDFEEVDEAEDPPEPQRSTYDPWQVLGLEADASREETVRAYRKLALRYHPDHNNGNDKRFKEIQKARDAIIKFLDREGV